MGWHHWESERLTGLWAPESWQAAKNLILTGLRVPESWRTAEKSAIKGEYLRPAGLLLPFTILLKAMSIYAKENKNRCHKNHPWRCCIIWQKPRRQEFAFCHYTQVQCGNPNKIVLKVIIQITINLTHRELKHEGICPFVAPLLVTINLTHRELHKASDFWTVLFKNLTPCVLYG